MMSPWLLFSLVLLCGSQLPAPSTLPSSCCYASLCSYPRNCRAEQTFSSISGFWPWCFITTTKKVTTTKWHDQTAAMFIVRDAGSTQNLQPTGWDLIALNMFHLERGKMAHWLREQSGLQAIRVCGFQLLVTPAPGHKNILSIQLFSLFGDCTYVQKNPYTDTDMCI